MLTSMPVRIPSDLLGLVHERRVIPFVGAGFSVGLGLPGWDGLLRQVAEDLRISEVDPRLDFDALYHDASEDFLRVAEYLYLRAGSNIGPLRLSISHALSVRRSLCSSTPHVELVNLGAPQVYTTNFDDGIEETYRELGQPMEVVSLPRDVAVADPQQTQIIKYHGDLRYDDTLVLTESQYWRRLDLESPMDLKFRSDLLGRSVLFIGYSFSDINIRVIWFKLMRMMEDVPESDRKPSYIVRFEPNPVLEALYRHVGLTTIVLDPDAKAKTDEDRTELLGEFLTELSAAAADEGGIPGNPRQRMFASPGLISRAKEELLGNLKNAPWLPSSHSFSILEEREIPQELKESAYEIIEKIADSGVVSLAQTGQIVRWGLREWGTRSGVVGLVLRALMMSFGREVLLRADLPWKEIWEEALPQEQARNLLKVVDSELRGHEAMRLSDDDLAYGIDIAKRLAAGLTQDEEVKQEAEALVERAAKIYPAAATYRPSKAGIPKPSTIMKEITAKAEKEAEDS